MHAACHDAGIAHLIFPARADDGKPHLPAKVGLKGLDGGTRVQPPQMGGLLNLDPIAVDRQQHRTPGATADEQRLDARCPQFGPKVAADVRASQQAGQRRARADVQARRGRGRRAGEQATTEQQHVVRSQRVRARGHVLRQEPGIAASPSQELLREGPWDRCPFNLFRGQVDDEQ